MEQFIQAVVMGIVQGLTEFLPVSSSGHLIIVPALLGWDDPFIESLAFSVMLHLGTLIALLAFFRAEWFRLLSARGALGTAMPRALALVPGISRSGISISAGLFAGLDREAAARFSFLMATPITAGAGAYETRKLLTGEAGVDVQVAPLVAGMIAAVVAGSAAIAILLRFLNPSHHH